MPPPRTAAIASTRSAAAVRLRTYPLAPVLIAAAAASGSSYTLRTMTTSDGNLSPHTAAMFRVVRELDGNPLQLLERLVPSRYLVCDLVVEEVYDQTPGPRAGQRVDDT